MTLPLLLRAAVFIGGGLLVMSVRPPHQPSWMVPLVNEIKALNNITQELTSRLEQQSSAIGDLQESLSQMRSDFTDMKSTLEGSHSNIAQGGGHGVQDDDGIPCAPKDFGFGSFVCVCNATYCDTVPRPSLPPEGEFLVYTSDISTNRFKKTQNSFVKEQNIPEGKVQEVADFVLDSSSTFQTIIGWGGAFTDAAAANILSLSTPAQDMLLKSYFSEDGVEYNLGRINMGGCDFSWRIYTYVDTEGDVALETFALQPEDLDFKIPLIKRAKAMSDQPLKLFASPWTAPGWMKTNHDYIGYGQLLEEMYQPWADYFIKFLESYAANDVSIWGLTAQNEPTNGYIQGFFFNCMGWTANEQRKWVAENLGPTLEAHGYGDIVLMIMDDQRYELPQWAETVLNDSTAAQYIDGIALHWYADGFSNPDRLIQTHEQFPDHFILGTEACTGVGLSDAAVILGSWERLERYAHDIIVDMNHWVTGWTDWNLALDTIGGPNWSNNFVDSPIIVNEDLDEFYKNPMFYAMGHFSKFVKEGAVRVSLTSENPQNLDTTAFRNPDATYALVILNRSEREIGARVQVEGRGIMTLIVGPRSLHTAFFI